MVSYISANQKNGFVLRLQEKERNRFQEYAEMLVSQEAIERASQFKGARQHARIIRGACCVELQEVSPRPGRTTVALGLCAFLGLVRRRGWP